MRVSRDKWEAKHDTLLSQRDSCIVMTPRVMGNRVIITGPDWKISGRSRNLTYSHWPPISRDSQHEYAKVRVIQTLFTYSSIALQPV